MEYCGAGSVLDIMKLRGIYHAMPKGIVKSLTEEEIATVLCDTLKGKTKNLDNETTMIKYKHKANSVCSCKSLCDCEINEILVSTFNNKQ